MLKQGLSLLIMNQEKSIDAELINSLPPLFAQFLRTYKVGEGLVSSDRILYKSGDLNWFTKIDMFDGVEMYGELYTGVIDHVFDYNKLALETKKYLLKVENWNREGFMQIGLIYHGDVLLLGVDSTNSDEIWRYGSGLLDTVLSKLDDNIFDFFKRLRQVIDEEVLDEWNIVTEDIYKNIDEDFWRIREDGKPSVGTFVSLLVT